MEGKILKKKRKAKVKVPPQITLGGKVALKAWRLFILPLIKDAQKSTREIGELLGVSHNTVAIWRRAYL
jgi:hypothetical protein